MTNNVKSQCVDRSYVDFTRKYCVSIKELIVNTLETRPIDDYKEAADRKPKYFARISATEVISGQFIITESRLEDCANNQLETLVPDEIK